MGAKELEVFQAVCTAVDHGDDVIDLQVAKFKSEAAPAALSSLLSEKGTPVMEAGRVFLRFSNFECHVTPPA
ncbi:MAG: hypothetical protein OXL37_11415 [Chloroflexota bacterium]|nr:hypothetical protein [Chloroflexota bacterium]